MKVQKTKNKDDGNDPVKIVVAAFAVLSLLPLYYLAKDGAQIIGRNTIINMIIIIERVLEKRAWATN